ncbi:MAG: phosphate propanoyltransferase [Anaerovoracaceae bacterium]|nr:phosphate propanoyltransferase [Bacillota bacterium]MDY3954783.1 phosphate propanoyltransferase [Anaerovoracaceae bacterium]
MYKVPSGISNKHLHVSERDLKILFGENHELTCKKMLKQPGQFACEETVDLAGPKGTLKRVRVLGPVRPETQVELSLTDARALGITAPVRESGKLEGTPGLTLIGPEGTVELDHGVIIALRHVHLSDEEAAEAGVSDKQMIRVKVEGERGLVFDNVLVRAGKAHSAEFHLDTDEGNAAGLDNGVMCELLP